MNVVGPDPADVGGIAELKWIAEYADLHGILMAPHGVLDGLFGIAAITAFFDGYLARAYGPQSSFGKFLDPVAANPLVSSALLMAPGFGHISGLTILPAAVILCREFLVSGLLDCPAGVPSRLPCRPLY